MQDDENKKYKGRFSDFSGCGCSLVIIWGILAAVSWAWHIHWLFGILMLLFLLSLLGA